MSLTVLHLYDITSLKGEEQQGADLDHFWKWYFGTLYQHLDLADKYFLEGCGLAVYTMIELISKEISKKEVTNMQEGKNVLDGVGLEYEVLVWTYVF